MIPAADAASSPSASISSRRFATSTSRSRAGPSAPPSHESSSRSGSDQLASRSGAATLRNARSRRVATRIWWRSSGSEPSRVPGSWIRIVRAWCASASASTPDGGSPRFASGSSAGTSSSARKSFGRCSDEEAPAFRSSFSSLRSVRSSPPTSSISSSRKRWTTRAPASTETESSTISAPRARTTSRRVRSRATGPSSRPRRKPTRSDVSSSGGRAGRPGCSSSTRAAPWGSFSCQTPAPLSTRWRSVRPCRASTRSGVSWYVDVKRRVGCGSPPSSGRTKPSSGASLTSRSSCSFTLRA